MRAGEAFIMVGAAPAIIGQPGASGADKKLGTLANGWVGADQEEMMLFDQVVTAAGTKGDAIAAR